jgi:hypothetical protein
MKRPHVLLQVAAIVSSVLLAGGLISYRAGAFNRFIAPSAPPADSGSNPAAEETPPEDAAQPDLAIMSSSKSGTITFTGKLSGTFSPAPSQKTEAPQQPAPDPEPAKPPTIMYGSKAPYNLGFDFNNLNQPLLPAPTSPQSPKPAP